MIPVIVFCLRAARVRASGTDVSRWIKTAEAAKNHSLQPEELSAI